MGFEPSNTKGEALRRIGQLLGEKFTLSKGSTIPAAVFTAATKWAGVSNEGDMPARGQRVVQKAGLIWDDKCDSRNSPSGGGATVTRTGLNRLLEALIRLDGSFSAAGESGVQQVFGAPYRPQVGGVSAAPTELMHDWDALDESTRAHMTLQNLLAEHVQSLGVEPLSPGSDQPGFDLAWEYAGTTVVVEVKTANETNHRQQARLGFGQVLEYAARLNYSTGGDFRPVLLLSRPPSDVDYLMSMSTGVVVIGPADFSALSLEDLLPLGPSAEKSVDSSL